MSCVLLLVSLSFSFLAMTVPLLIEKLDFDLIFGVGAPLLSTAFRLFRGGEFLLVKETGVPGEFHRPSIGKLSILVN